MRRFFLGAVAVVALLPASVWAQTGRAPVIDDPALKEQAARTFIVRLPDRTTGADVRGKARAAVARVGGKVRHVYENSIKGFVIEVEPSVVGQLASAGLGILSIEQDQVMTIQVDAASGGFGATSLRDTTDSQGEVTPWGVTRVAGGFAPATGAMAFVLDTGISNHPDLIIDRTRAFSIDRKTTDGNGHGTHVAGTIAARKGNDANGSTSGNGGVVGVAPGATVVPIRVLNDKGSGTISGIIAGVDHVAKLRRACGAATDTVKCPPERWVANMSLGGGANSTLDTAVRNAADTGVRFAIAAGNSNVSATLASPARVDHVNVLTVSASDSADVMASFSNFGNPPVDLAAPGVNVRSTWISNGYRTISGTSMAAPHVAGIMLLAPSLNASTAAASTCGAVKSDKDNTPDPIVFNSAQTSIPCTY